MSYLTRVTIFKTGERFPVLLYKETLQPVSLPTRYVIDQRRETKQWGTINKDVRVLKWFYEWADLNNIDLETFLRKGEQLTASQLIGLCRYMRSTRNSSVVGSINLKPCSANAVLSSGTFNSYLNIIEDFLNWANKIFIPKNFIGDENIRLSIESAKERVNHVFLNHKVTGHSAPKTGLSSEEVIKLRQVIDPNSPDNPFKPSFRIRNQLIIELFLQTGIRRGELLKLKMNHLPQGPKHTLSVFRDPDDKDDPRKNAPEVKTRSREIPLPIKLTKDLWSYVEKNRKKGRHQFLFTSHRKGAPLALFSVNHMFRFIAQECMPELEGRLHPHALRHTFNDNFVALTKELGWSDEKTEKTQKYINGWAEDSNMPDRYTQRTIQAQTMELMEKYQENLYKTNK